MEMAPGTARLAIETENQAVLMDSLILCKFLRGVFDDRLAAMSEMLHLVTGWDVTSGELWSTANRIVDAKKRFNISQGWTPDGGHAARSILLVAAARGSERRCCPQS